VEGGADAGHDAAAEQARHGGLGGGVDGRALAGGDQRPVGEGADAQRRGQRRAVGQRHHPGGVEGGEAQVRPPPAARPAVAAHGPPVEDHEVARRHAGHAVADGLDHAGGLVAEQEGEVVVDPALAVVEVGVADAARLHGDQRLAGPGVGHDHGLDRHRLALAAGDHPAYLVRHASPSSSGSVRARPYDGGAGVSPFGRRPQTAAAPSGR
jgi:hypothetical protein